MNRIIKVELTLQEPGAWSNHLGEHYSAAWLVEVTKEFDPEYGGGTQVFAEWAPPQIHLALDVARMMVTMHPARRTDS